jgi:hypothetical protein
LVEVSNSIDVYIGRRKAILLSVACFLLLTLMIPTSIAQDAVTGDDNCHPSYQGACVPITSDVVCLGGRGNGPAYVGRVIVVGPDVYGLDRDGIACDAVPAQNSGQNPPAGSATDR